MELYVGGYSQGKLAYVLQSHKTLTTDQVFDWEKADETDFSNDKRIQNHLHFWVRKMLLSWTEDMSLHPDEMEKLQQKIFGILDGLVEQNPEVIFICDEVGGGIVPLAKEDNLYRELVGRVLCHLAGKAEHMERIICGVGQVIIS